MAVKCITGCGRDTGGSFDMCGPCADSAEGNSSETGWEALLNNQEG
jgi:hypothetical protein